MSVQTRARAAALAVAMECIDLVTRAGLGGVISRETQQQRAGFMTIEADFQQKERFEIIAISAGTGNGWDFSAAVLRESLVMWDGVECFIDHEQSGGRGGRSVRDLAGMLRGAAWDEQRQGIRCELVALGPGAAELAAMGKTITQGEARPKVGFSADLFFMAKGKTVVKITKVNSVDLVYNPARGGEFIRALNQKEADRVTMREAYFYAVGCMELVKEANPAGSLRWREVTAAQKVIESEIERA